MGASATNLSNAKNQKQHLPAGIVANAKTIGNGSMSFQLQFNPVAPNPEYQLQASLTNVDLVRQALDEPHRSLETVIDGLPHVLLADWAAAFDPREPRTSVYGSPGAPMPAHELAS